MKAAREEEVVDAVREARERRRTLEIVGGGTRRSFGRPVACDDVLDLSGLSGIVNYEPEELILTVKPGTPLEEIEALLSSKGQRLGFEPQDWCGLLGSQGVPTIAGAVSADACGPAAMRFGRARDHLLGIRAVNGFGEAFKAGGRVVKNVTGFDIPKLVCGAMGTLCVLTELTFRVFPKPPQSKTFAVGGLSVEEGLHLLRRVWSSPLDATALSFANGVARVRLEGAGDALDEKRTLLRAMAPAPEDEEPPDAPMDGDIWRVFLPPSRAAGLIAALGGTVRVDWAGGLVWIGTHDRGIHEIAARHGGTAVLVRACGDTAPFAPEEPARAALTRAVKAAFDPLGLFNPGRMHEGV